MPTSRPKTRRSDGFTLVEMLVVLTIMGLLAAVAVGRFSSAGDHGRRLKLLAQLRSELAEARAKALSTGQSVPLAIGPDQKNDVEIRTADGAPLAFYSDGSSTGGVIYIGGRPALTIDWLTGASHDAS